MKNILILLLSISIFSCQKSVKPEPKQLIKNFGAVGNPDEQYRGKPISSKKDTDRDGIPDIIDECPTQPETYNGYQDSDGCPDTAPPPPPVIIDTDSDGILDSLDLCPTEKEIYNGYKDTDGCPDTLPIIPPPTTFPFRYALTMPPVEYQGGEGSCVAFAITYARSAIVYYTTGATSYSYSTNILSPEMLFNKTKASNFDGRDGISCGSSALITAMNYLRDTGTCLWASMPYTDVSCITYPNAAQLAEAQTFRIKSYSMISASDTTAIKTILTSGRPLVHQITVDYGFYNAGPDFIWKEFIGALGAHDVCMVGYDDSKHAFKVINEWGTSWGDGGYSWIDYDFLKTISSSLFVMNF